MNLMRKTLALAVAALAVAASVAGIAGAGSAGAATSPTVSTANGEVQGTVTADNRVFLGIPYAAPPTGNLRWEPPQPAADWSGVLNATQPGPECAQVEELSGDTLAGSENCLNLNVYTPVSSSPATLPVMIFIPGGGYVFGSNNTVNPSVLAATEHMIVVTINYRLGALGFLDLPSLSSENAAAAGNFGLLDQQAAMKWVQANIANFGGDPSRVTIAGESTGGASVLANMISPTAAGLFHGAIVESGAGTGFTTQAAAQAQGAAFAASVGCTNPATQLACLRALPMDTILSNELDNAPPILLPTDMVWSPTVGGSDLPNMPAAAFASGSYNKVPILQGTNHDEWRLFAGVQMLQGDVLTASSYVGLMDYLFGSRAASVLAVYPSSNYSSPDAAYAAVATDEGFVCHARTIDQAVSQTVPVYAYEFNDPNAPEPFTVPGFPLGAYHTAELLYVFPTAGFPGFTAAQVALSDQIMTYWGDFVAYSTPNPGPPTWLPYNNVSDWFMSLAPSNTGMISTFSAEHNCSFWASFGV
ncbi:MAG TPA: carboxylesterase family protein [Trebonia sp.]